MTGLRSICGLSAWASLVLTGCGTAQEQELTLSPDEAAPALEVALAPLSGEAMATWDQWFQTPACLNRASSCDTGTLVEGRGPVGPEADAPNTLFSSCADQPFGVYQLDRSVERVRIRSVNGAGFMAGKQAIVEATVWASANYSAERVAIYYAPNANVPQWQQIGSQVPTGPGLQTITKTLTLSTGLEQAIRVIFRSDTGATVPCAPPSGMYADQDDLVFRLGDLPPQVTMNSPGAVVSGTVTLTADASDDFLVNDVYFYAANSTHNLILGSATATTPYQRNWNTLNYGDGTWTLTAKAFDANNQTTVSAPVTVVVDNTLPWVMLTNPSIGADPFSGTVTLEAVGGDNLGIERVEFYRDSTLLGTVTQAPYQLTWNTLVAPNGITSIQAKVYDLAGHSNFDSVYVTIANGPTGSITSPAPLSVLSGTATFAVDAQDPQGVDRVTFYVGTKYVTWDGTAPYSINFNTLNFANGEYVLTARIFDTEGNMTVTEGVPIHIQN